MYRLILVVLLMVAVPVLGQSPVVSIRVTPTLDTSAYAAGDCLHVTPITISTDLSTESGVVEAVVVEDKSGQGKNMDVVFFSKLPSTICAAVNGAYDPADADLVWTIGTSKITQHAVYNDNGVSENTVTKIPFNTNTLYAAMVAREAVTYAAADLTLKVVVRRN